MPGVEDINLIFLTNNSLALSTNKHLPLNEVLMQMVRNEDKIREILKSCKRWGKPYSSKELGDFIEQKFKEEHKIEQIAK